MKYKTFIRLLAVSLLFVLGSSACIEVTYETTIHADGSGTQLITMKMDKLMNMMGKDILNVDSVSPEVFREKMSTEYVGSLEEFAGNVNSVEGLDNFKTTFNNYALTSSLDFNDQSMLGLPPLGNLNMLTRNLKTGQEGKKSRLSWTVNAEGLEEILLQDKVGEDKKTHLDQLMVVFAMLGDGQVTSIFHLPGKVKKVSDKNLVQVSSDKKTVTVKTSLKDVLEGKVQGDYFFEYK